MFVFYAFLSLQTLSVLPMIAERPLPPSFRVGKFVQINEMLCENPRYAMDFAAAVSKGEPAELAKDTVGRMANREVCGRFIGLAIAQATSVATRDGIVYQLVAFRFREDNRVGWLAETSFAPGPFEKRQTPL